MKILHIVRIVSALLLVSLILHRPTAFADDSDDLTAMLHAFLAGVGEVETHDRFWADDLIYTSSRGTRTNKAEILAGVRGANDDEGREAGPAYTAQDIRISIYGETAIVAFRLIATPADASDVAGIQGYLNTGTFLKRDGIWQVVAWQATVEAAVGND